MKSLYAGVTITQGPEDWQIIQRDKQGVGSLSLKGTWQTNELDFSIQARIVQESNQMPVTNGNFLLNIGPNAKGEIPEKSQKVLREVGVAQ